MSDVLFVWTTAYQTCLMRACVPRLLSGLYQLFDPCSIKHVLGPGQTINVWRSNTIKHCLVTKHFTLWTPCLALFDRVWSYLVVFDKIWRPSNIRSKTQNISFVCVLDGRCFVRLDRRLSNMFDARMRTTLAQRLVSWETDRLSNFSPTSNLELSKIARSVVQKSCCLDPLPATLLKEHLDLLLPSICSIVNLSLVSGLLPSSSTCLNPSSQETEPGPRSSQ